MKRRNDGGVGRGIFSESVASVGIRHSVPPKPIGRHLRPDQRLRIFSLSFLLKSRNKSTGQKYTSATLVGSVVGYPPREKITFDPVTDSTTTEPQTEPLLRMNN